jgi:threonine dehydrogenase-like Zn-dependent dehydrogenase
VKRSLTKTDPSYAAFQKYVLATELTATKIADNTTFEAAAATVLNLATAIAALNVYMHLDRAPVDGPAPRNGKTVLIYGGSSSMGGLAVRYVGDAGYDVVTTSSPANRDFVSSLGAKVIVDHTQSPDVVVKELKSHGPYEAMLDCIGTPPVDALFAQLLAETTEGETKTYFTVLPPMGGVKFPEGVRREFASYSMVLENENRDLGRWFYKEYLPGALANGRIVPSRVEKVKGGLRGVQEALDKSMTVSGKKVIVDPLE